MKSSSLKKLYFCYGETRDYLLHNMIYKRKLKKKIGLIRHFAIPFSEMYDNRMTSVSIQQNHLYPLYRCLLWLENIYMKFFTSFPNSYFHERN